MFKSSSPEVVIVFLGTLDPDDREPLILRNFGNYFPVDNVRAQHVPVFSILKI
jgi:hypothetical protein